VAAGFVKQPRGARVRRLFDWYVAVAEKRAGLLLVFFALVGAVALTLALKLELHTDMAELLPDNHPAVQAFRRIAGKQKGAINLVMIVSSPDEAANYRFIEALRPALEKMVPTVFSDIQWRPDTEVPEHAAKWKWLYADLKDLENAEDLLDRIISKRTSPLHVDIDDDPDEELKKLREKLNQKLPPRKEARYYEMTEAGTHWLGVMLWRRSDGIASAGDHETMVKMQEVVARANPAGFHPQMTVGFTGGIAQSVEEQNGIREDLIIATSTVVLLVGLVIWLYFRRMALLLVIGAAPVLGLLVVLACASLTIHYLNVTTSFLISIILGNGINTPIILLGRYGEERNRGAAVGEALTVAMGETMLGTLTAMAAASIAYGSLLLTSFRGFSQFGLIGGGGMLLVWALSFLLVPPLVIFGERLLPGRLTPRANLWRRPYAWLGGIAARRPLALVLVSVICLGAAATPLLRYLKDPIEWNFNNLRSESTSSNNLWPRMEALGMGDVGAGYVGNNGVLIVDRPEQAQPVADALWKQDQAKGKDHVLKAVRTVYSLVPKDQEEKLELLARIRRKIDKHRHVMEEDEAREVDAWRPPDYLRQVTVDDLPRLVREAFTETDGHFGRLVGVDADNAVYYDWNGHDLLRMSKALEVDAEGQHWVVASVATVFAGMLEAIINDGPRVTLAALIGVVLLILIAFGRGALPVLVTLAVGIAWLGGLAGALSAWSETPGLTGARATIASYFNLKINFMNFVALPITLGVGADYAANIWARLRREGTGNLPAVIGDTGSAVALCSLTTIIGYSSLLMSRNHALRSFGMLADLGELTCLVAALVLLPALVRLFPRRRGTQP
jgi:hypothetical protein